MQNTISRLEKTLEKVDSSDHVLVAETEVRLVLAADLARNETPVVVATMVNSRTKSMPLRTLQAVPASDPSTSTITPDFDRVLAPKSIVVDQDLGAEPSVLADSIVVEAVLTLPVPASKRHLTGQHQD